MTEHTARQVVVVPDAGLLAEVTAARLILALLDAQSLDRPVHAVLTGGTVGIATLAAVRTNPVQRAVDWAGVHVWWGDERFLPAGDPDRNEVQAREALLDHVPIPPENVHAVAGPDRADSAEAAAEAYAAELAAHAPGGSGAAVPGSAVPGSAVPGSAVPGSAVPGSAVPGSAVPRFAVLMLGVGPDAHVASLFPGLPGTAVEDRTVVAVHGSPKPPPVRVSLTFPAIGSASQVWLVAAGAEKAPAVAAALGGADRGEAPAAGARGRERTLWLLDAAAAGGSQ